MRSGVPVAGCGIRTRDQVIIVVCQEGFQSSLAAAALQRLGLRNATDLDGGFTAWREAGMPVVPPGVLAQPRRSHSGHGTGEGDTRGSHRVTLPLRLLGRQRWRQI